MLGLTWLILLLAILLPDFSGETRVRLTADLALAYWWLVVAGRIIGIRPRPQLRSLWTLGAISFVIHVLVSFHETHGWSHANAVQHVHDVSGFGPGIVFSHLFTLLWLLDSAWWWLAPTRYEQRSRLLDRTIHGYMAFLVFNGTVVYENGPIRWIGLIAFAGLGVLLWLARRRQSAQHSATELPTISPTT
ncbi:hypothetical protein [Tuwongella immobilis]|uniref:Uncharacterized protein n=1 Tax=Tuwongella immobilis TaxID=692036 RepID=A0A6C2YUR8_9BACT|nr:hypothetical protein [Tuwongella immobilis]VIP05478.1 Uncharacterized protein OS=Chthoniobacter flavus Ellin428 GN=CfE428DRAFT_5423 PE=4 SV=1 [Tuwongella immobilis]VTS08312.1 Uncharacterized protein OS=Chthoniobacter flavus Ellin428 GN=CfE428DRAFT_5423 PE=4 SV=1 [Tuwongella immobilis]